MKPFRSENYPEFLDFLNTNIPLLVERFKTYVAQKTSNSIMPGERKYLCHKIAEQLFKNIESARKVRVRRTYEKNLGRLLSVNGDTPLPVVWSEEYNLFLQDTHDASIKQWYIAYGKQHRKNAKIPLWYTPRHHTTIQDIARASDLQDWMFYRKDRDKTIPIDLRSIAQKVRAHTTKESVKPQLKILQTIHEKIRQNSTKDYIFRTPSRLNISTAKKIRKWAGQHIQLPYRVQQK
jgi:hypothetical protein